ncbi:MAG: hypothetical protein ACK5LO_08055 [Leucobacter sp.]
MAGKIVAWVVGLLLTGLYVSVVVAGIGNIVLLPDMAASMGLSMTAVGWFWLSFGIALPVVAFALALLFGRGRSAAMRLLVLATGIGVVAAVQLEIMHLVPQSSFFA